MKLLLLSQAWGGTKIKMTRASPVLLKPASPSRGSGISHSWVVLSIYRLFLSFIFAFVLLICLHNHVAEVALALRDWQYRLMRLLTKYISKTLVTYYQVRSMLPTHENNDPQMLRISKVFYCIYCNQNPLDPGLRTTNFGAVRSPRPVTARKMSATRYTG